MKTNVFKKVFIVSIFFCFIQAQSYSQNLMSKESLMVLHLDSKGIMLDPIQLGNLTRIEVGKLNIFEVIDKYDIEYLIEKDTINIRNCYGKLCLVNIGKKMGAENVLTGSVELYGETIIITLQLINVTDNKIIKTQIKEFLNYQNDIQAMIHLTLCEMFGIEKNKVLEDKLTNINSYESTINNPYAENLNLSGPRMGFTGFTGETADVIMRSKNKGGYEAYPVMFQFGYQFETQYLNEGNFQALFEFIPMVTGLDQGFFLPSLTIMNGLRNNVNGFEIAFGPNFFISREQVGYYIGNKWYEETDWNIPTGTNLDNYEKQTILHSEGYLKLNSAFIIAVGKTFRSGKLNIPVNAFFVPTKYGFRFGVSFGYNAKK